MCHKLINDNVNFKFALTISPVICAILTDEVFMNRYKLHLEKKILFAEREFKRLKKEPEQITVLESFLQLLNQNMSDFEKYNYDLIGQINRISLKGYIEILASTGVPCFLPMYGHLPEAVYAQIEMGQVSHPKFFMNMPSGFWLPSLGYYKNLDLISKKYDYDYSILNANAFLLSDKIPEYGVFSPAVSENGFKFLALDLNAYDQTYFSENALFKHSTYSDTANNIAFSLSQEYLYPLFNTANGRKQTGFRYNNKETDVSIYNIKKAIIRIKEDAAAFVKARTECLTEAEKIMNGVCPMSVCVLPSQLLGLEWYEGIN